MANIIIRVFLDDDSRRQIIKFSPVIESVVDRWARVMYLTLSVVVSGSVGDTDGLYIVVSEFRKSQYRDTGFIQQRLVSSNTQTIYLNKLQGG